MTPSSASAVSTVVALPLSQQLTESKVSGSQAQESWGVCARAPCVDKSLPLQVAHLVLTHVLSCLCCSLCALHVLPCFADTPSSAPTGNWSQLPQEVLVDVLRRVPQSDRLDSCAGVSTAWLAAVCEATDSLSLLQQSPEQLQAAWRQYAAWLGPHLTSLHVEVDWRHYPNGSCVLEHLPCARLQELTLQSVSLMIAGGALHAVTALTRLHVAEGRLGDCAALAALTSIQHLHLSNPCPKERCELPSCVLHALSELTHLHLHNIDVSDDFVLSGRGICLPSLQHLAVLQYNESSGVNKWLRDVTRLVRLTRLEVSSGYCCSVMPNLAALTALQELILPGSSHSAVSPALFDGITWLRRVDVAHVSFAGGESGNRIMLAWLRQQPMLERLCWEGYNLMVGEPAASVGPHVSLAGFSKLQELVLSSRVTHIPSVFLPAGVWKQIFVRQLPELTALDFCGNPPSNAMMLQLAQCCPALRDLKLSAANSTRRSRRERGMMLRSWLQPSVLLPLTTLTSLYVAGMASDSAPALAELSSLQELRSLHLSQPCAMGLAAVQHLTALQSLTRLRVESRTLPEWLALERKQAVSKVVCMHLQRAEPSQAPVSSLTCMSNICVVRFITLASMACGMRTTP